MARGESALAAGLLMAPQGLGAAFVMPIAGKLADKVGGGRVAVVGLVIATLGTLPFAFVTGDTPYALLAVVLVIRGIGIGSTMMPAMAAAYATLDSAVVPRDQRAERPAARRRRDRHVRDGGRSPARNPQRARRAAGRDRRQRPRRSGERRPLAGAFAATFWWAVGACLLALMPAVILAARARAARAPRAGELEQAARRPRPLRHFHDLAELRPLLVLAERVALDGRGEPALRRQAELVDVDELRRLLDRRLSTSLLSRSPSWS